MKTILMFAIISSSLLFSCSSKEINRLASIKYSPKTDQLFKIGISTNSMNIPLQSMPVWNYKTMEKIGVKKITVYSFGGKNPSDTLQKNCYNFDWTANNTNFSEKGITPTGSYESIGKYSIINQNQTEIDLTIIDEKKQKKSFKTKIYNKGNVRSILKFKKNSKIDTTLIISLDKLTKVHIIKIGDFVQSVQFFTPQNTKTSQLKKLYEQVKKDYHIYNSSALSVIYTENSLPINSFSLDENFTQFAKEKEWKYDKNYCVVKYLEFYNNSLVKTVSFTYSKNLLPSKMIVNSTTFYFEFQ